MCVAGAIQSIRLRLEQPKPAKTPKKKQKEEAAEVWGQQDAKKGAQEMQRNFRIILD